MNSNAFRKIARRLMSHPAAPYHEHDARSMVEAICAEEGLACKRDAFGNVLASLQTAPKQRPLVLAAHLDHPGFEIVSRLSPTSWLARFLGGVPDIYFKPGIPLRLMPGTAPARLGKRLGEHREFEILAAAELETIPQFAVWELEDFAIGRGRIHGRACDDLIGVAAILATLIELKTSGAKVNVLGAISRAEEVGFHGALTLAAGSELPKDSLIVSLETSRELPPVKMGKGVIIRVGDRASTFDSGATRFLVEAATARQAGDPKFRFQRALMSGGTCEATAYQEFGFQTTGVCVALGNYHNCGPQNKIAAEYVSTADACGMVDLLVSAASEMRHYPALAGKLPARIKKMLGDARTRLAADALSLHKAQ